MFMALVAFVTIYIGGLTNIVALLALEFSALVWNSFSAVGLGSFSCNDGLVVSSSRPFQRMCELVQVIEMCRSEADQQTRGLAKRSG